MKTEAEHKFDELYGQTITLVLEERKCSTSFLQRRLSIGYNQAARLIERLEGQGIVSSANSVGKREVLVPDLRGHSGPYALFAADAAVAEIIDLVQRGELDARSRAADAALEYAITRFGSGEPFEKLKAAVAERNARYRS